MNTITDVLHFKIKSELPPKKQKEYKVVMENVQNIKKYKEKFQHTETGMTYFHSKFAHTSI